jgi:DNA-binding PadR family transcriptional regulator
VVTPASVRVGGLTIRPYLFYIEKQMPRGELLGSLEYVVLLAVMHLGDEAYGMTVRREIESRTGRDLSIGAIYSTLERLEAKGFVSSYTGEPTAQRGGRAKRHFRMEGEGKRALASAHEAIRRMTAGLKRGWNAT